MEFSHSAVIRISDVDYPGRVDGDAERQVERGVWGDPLARVPGQASARDRADHAAEFDLADAVVARVGHEQVALLVQREGLSGTVERAGREIEAHFGGGLPVAGVALAAVAGDRGDHSLEVDLTDSVVEAVGDVEVAFGVDRQSLRRVQHRLACYAAVARVARLPGTRNGADRAVRGDHPHPVVASVR